MTKLEKLLNWQRIAELNNRIDMGMTPNSLAKWVNSQGFLVNKATIYEYHRAYKEYMETGMPVKDILGLSPEPAIKVDGRIITPICKIKKFQKGEEGKDSISLGGAPIVLEPASEFKYCKNELQALDKIIHMGFNTLNRFPDTAVIPPKLLLECVELKSKITRNTHYFLTDYGINEQKAIFNGKMEVLISTLMEFIPVEQRNEAIEMAIKAEDDYYRSCGKEVYDEYKRLVEDEG